MIKIQNQCNLRVLVCRRYRFDSANKKAQFMSVPSVNRRLNAIYAAIRTAINSGPNAYITPV